MVLTGGHTLFPPSSCLSESENNRIRTEAMKLNVLNNGLMFSEPMFLRQPLFRIPSFLISSEHRLGLTGAREDKLQEQP